ncbi:MAG: hypothetical protein HDS62_00430 [Bacteroidales bacterium]|nr:hypothetical protein [Bacteroidales bacterium]MBD5235998.1 hypothetical protein [Bacteroidales bacterium]
MCYTATLPTVIKSENLNSDLLNLTRIFNRWLKMLTNYGKLDETTLQNDFIVIAKVVKSHETKQDIKRAVQRCRDYALSAVMQITNLVRSLTSALSLLCKAQENRELRKVKKAYADQGMTERYRPLSKRLAKEKIRKIGREVIYTDRHTDDAETTRLVRRIIEKRAAQEAHKNAGKHDRETNRYRHSIQRAVSFNLYNKRYAEYDAELRARGTHWKVSIHNSKGKKVLVAKFSYNTYEEAVEACTRYMMAHPEDSCPMSAYKCDYCGKWHIGHERLPQQYMEPATKNLQEKDEKISA